MVRATKIEPYAIFATPLCYASSNDAAVNRIRESTTVQIIKISFENSNAGYA